MHQRGQIPSLQKASISHTLETWFHPMKKNLCSSWEILTQSQNKIKETENDGRIVQGINEIKKKIPILTRNEN